MIEKLEHGMASYVTRREVYNNKRHQTSGRIESVADLSDDEWTCDPPSIATVISRYIHIQIHDVC